MEIKLLVTDLNIWLFLGRDMWSSSHASFLTLSLGNWKHDLSPNKAGNFLYCLFMAFLLFTCSKGIWAVLRKKIASETKRAGTSLPYSYVVFFSWSFSSWF